MKKRVIKILPIALLLLIPISLALDFSPFDASVKLKPTTLPPEIIINTPILICEDTSLSTYFNVTDPNPEDYLTVTFSPEPTTPFFLNSYHTQGYSPLKIEMFSSVSLTREYINIYQRTINAVDSTNLAATKDITLEVIEKNDPPQVQPIPVQTIIYLQGTLPSNPTNFFSYQVQVTDEEDGTQDDENLTFTISFDPPSNLFTINKKGVMDFIPDETHIGNYLITVNTTDKGIPNRHEKIYETCNQTGGPITNSTTFQLTISNQSTPPNITSYYPLELKFSTLAETQIYFNISVYDKEGTLPDTYWFVDDTQAKFDKLNLTYEFHHIFPCSTSGIHTVKATATDGIFNTSIQWNITVTPTTCPPSPPGGGGGGHSTTPCDEKWACPDWNNCQNLEQIFILNLIERADYQDIKNKCRLNNWTDEICGFQLRKCFDVNKCTTLLNRPPQIQECHFTENPNCEDQIKNCHDGSCELLIDCGGPCQPCPTCTDRIQNQGEADIDCGGPCPTPCPTEKPFLQRPAVQYTIAAILLIIIAILITKLVRIIQKNNKLKTQPKSPFKIRPTSPFKTSQK